MVPEVYTYKDRKSRHNAKGKGCVIPFLSGECVHATFAPILWDLCYKLIGKFIDINLIKYHIYVKTCYSTRQLEQKHG